MSDFEIRTPQSPFDMSAWCAEKSSNVGKCVSKAVDLLAQSDCLDDDQRELLLHYLRSSLYDISKLMSFSTGTEWSTADARDAQENGYEGYQRLAVKYGILHQTDANANLSRVNSFCDELSKLLWGDRSPNRTFVHDLLSRTTIEHAIVQKTAKTIELVTQGLLEWKDFCIIMDTELRELDTQNPKPVD